MASREELAEAAQRSANLVTSEGGPARGLRVVVVTMDDAGEFVGVGGNLVEHGLKEVLFCALHGEDRIDHVKERK